MCSSDLDPMNFFHLGIDALRRQLWLASVLPGELYVEDLKAVSLDDMWCNQLPEGEHKSRLSRKGNSRPSFDFIFLIAQPYEL